MTSAVNKSRGEIQVTVQGKPFTMVMNFGALAALEAKFGAFADMLGNFTSGEHSLLECFDLMNIIAKSNHEQCGMPLVEVAKMTPDEAVEAVVQLFGSVNNGAKQIDDILPDDKKKPDQAS